MKSALVAVTLCAAALAQDQSGRIIGTVTDSITRLPVKKADVNAIPSGNTTPFRQTFASTDANGVFTLEGVPKGSYMLIVTHQSYGTPSRTPTVEVRAGEDTRVAIALPPTPIVSGRIVDEDGDPMHGCLVHARPAAHLERETGNGFSDENGEYRMHGLAAGKYFFEAQCMEQPFTPRPFSSGPDPPPATGYPRQLFPLAPDLKSAQEVTLVAGVEKSGIDFRMRPAPVTVVRGSLAGPDWRTASAGLNAMLVPDGQRQGEYPPAALDPDKGTFEFHRVFPGSYDVVAIASGQSTVSAVTRIEVKDRPVEVVLNPVHASELNGTVVMVDDDGSGKQIPFETISVQLQNLLPIAGGGSTNAKADGTFSMESVVASRYRVRVAGPGVFAKSIWFGNTEITDGILDLSAGASQPLRVLLSTKTGNIVGTMQPGVSAIVLPQDDLQGSYGVAADATGNFHARGIPPGKYRLCITLPGQPMSDDGCTEVIMHEGETVTLDLKPASQ